jgi:hypothetical protein
VTTRVPTTTPSRWTPDRPGADCLDYPLESGRRRLAVPRRLAFWPLAFVFAATLLGTTLPTPLYDIYQAQWHAFFVAWYAGMIIPVVGVGLLTGFTGTFPAVLAFSLLLAVLSLFSFASIRRTLQRWVESFRNTDLPAEGDMQCLTIRSC